MSAPKVSEYPEENYHAARIRAGQLNRAVADALGWRIAEREIRVSPQQAYHDLESSRGMFGAPDGPTLSAGYHVERYWVDQDGTEQGSALFTDENEALPDWQGDVDEPLPGRYVAWQREGTWHVCYAYVSYSLSDTWTIYAESQLTQQGNTLAEARAKAWLALKEKQ
jgi:hypothetical protein